MKKFIVLLLMSVASFATLAEECTGWVDNCRWCVDFNWYGQLVGYKECRPADGTPGVPLPPPPGLAVVSLEYQEIDPSLIAHVRATM